MELKLFGQVGYMTIDPKNVEALNSSRFNGKTMVADDVCGLGTG